MAITITAEFLKTNFLDKGQPVSNMGRFLSDPNTWFDGPALLMMMGSDDLNTSGPAWDVAYKTIHPDAPRGQYEQIPFDTIGASSTVTPEEYTWAEKQAEDLGDTIRPMSHYAGGLLRSKAPLPEPVFRNAVRRAKTAYSTTSTEGIAKRIVNGQITGEQRRHATKEIGWTQLLGMKGSWPEMGLQQGPAGVLSDSEIQDAWKDLSASAEREVASPSPENLKWRRDEPVNGIQKLLSTESGRLPKEAYEELLRGTHPAFELKDGQWLRRRVIQQTPYPEHHRLLLDQLRTRKEEFGNPKYFDHQDLGRLLTNNHHYKPEFLNDVFDAGFPEMIAARTSGIVHEAPGLAQKLHDYAIKNKDSTMAYDLIRNEISSPEQMAEHIRAFPSLKKQLQEDGHHWTNPDLFSDDKVAVAFGTNKLRQARDFILAKGKTELPPKQMPAGDWAAGRAKNGNISAAGLQQAIDSAPRIPYNVTHGKWPGSQRHSKEISKVFQLNMTLAQVQKMKEAGVYDKFRKMHEASMQSSHPVGPAGIGWVRWTGGKGEGVFIDEVQSDLGQSFVKQAKAQAAQEGEDIEEVGQLAAEMYGDEDVHKTISNILFGGKHPSEVLQEAFHEWLRTPQEKKTCKMCGAGVSPSKMHPGRIRCNNNNPGLEGSCRAYDGGLFGDLSPDQIETKRESFVGEPIHIWQPESKAAISLDNPDEKLPGHFYVGYRDVPSKKMGMKSGEYGELKTQSGGFGSHKQSNYFKNCPGCGVEVNTSLTPFSPKGEGYRECPSCGTTFETFGATKREDVTPGKPTWKDEIRKSEDQRETRPSHFFQEHMLPGPLLAEGYKLNIGHMPGIAIATVHRQGKVIGHVGLVNWEPEEEWQEEPRAGLRDAVLRILKGHAKGKQEEDGWNDVLPGERRLSKAEPGDLHPETPPGFHAQPQGSHVTVPHQTYSQGAAAKPRGVQAPGGQNIHVRQHHEPSNAGRTLMVQFSTNLLQGGRQPDESDAYYDNLYSKREGYNRGEDFWEVPQWQAHIAHSMPNVDHYTVRDPKEAVEFLKTAGYKNAAFSSLDVTAPFIRQLAEAVPSQNIAVGGYSDLNMYKGLPNVQVHPSVQSFVESEGHEYKPGYDYRHFQGMKVIPRLTLSDGCRHNCTFCLTPNSLVISEEGLKPISEIRLGELVLTHIGQYKPVTRLFRRWYDGDVYGLNSGGISNAFPTTVTGEHAIWMKDVGYSVGKKSLLESRWVDARDITFGKMSPRYAYPRTKETQEPTVVPGADWLSLSPELMSLVGWYLSEGYISWSEKRGHHRVTFCLGHSDREMRFAETIRDVAKRCGLRAHIYRLSIGIRVMIDNVKLARWLHDQFGKLAHGKKIPLWVRLLPADLLKPLIKSWADGDGWYYVRKGTSTWKVTTVSANLAVSLREIALKCGMSATVNKHYSSSVIQGRKVNNKQSYSVIFHEIRGTKNSSVVSDDRYVYRAPLPSNVSHYSGMVYNLEVEGDNSYCTPAFAVHNCCVPKQVVEKPMAEVEQQADAFAKHLPSDLIYLNDKTFGQAPNHAELPRLYQRIKSQNPAFKGFVIQTTAAQMKRFTPEFLQNAGIRHVELGIESVNDPILRAHKKPANEALINEAAQKIRQAGSSLIPNIMVGLPGEDETTYGKTMDWLKQNRDIISHVNAYNLALYEDSELGKKLQAVNAADRDENQQVKSWMVNPAVHKQFAEKLFQFANEQLEQPIGHVSSPENLTQPLAKAEAYPVKSPHAPASDPQNYQVYESPLGHHMLTPEGNEQIFDTADKRDKYLQWHQMLRGAPAGIKSIGLRKTEDPHPPAAATVLVYNENGQVLWGRRQKDGKLTLPGGHIEAGESPATGAVRELQEEAGIVPEAISHFGTANTDDGLPVYMFQAHVHGQVPHSGFDPDNEVTTWEWVDCLMGLPPEIKNNLAHPRNVVVEHMGW